MRDIDFCKSFRQSKYTPEDGSYCHNILHKFVTYATSLNYCIQWKHTVQYGKSERRKQENFHMQLKP